MSVLIGLSAYGIHRYVIIYLFLKNRKRVAVPAGRFEPPAAVTTAAVEVEKPRWSTCNVGRKPMTAYQQQA